MQQLTTEHSSIAWFKLAELVARREKERALSIYRLLIHAWNDEAYALQLKGDLLWAFQDYLNAEVAYRAAAVAYDTSGRCMQAAFVYAHLDRLELPLGELRTLAVKSHQYEEQLLPSALPLEDTPSYVASSKTLLSKSPTPAGRSYFAAAEFKKSFSD